MEKKPKRINDNIAWITAYLFCYFSFTWSNDPSLSLQSGNSASLNVCITMKVVIISRREWGFILRCSVQSSSTALREMSWCYCYSAVHFIHLFTGQLSPFQLIIYLTFSLQALFINAVKCKINFNPYNKRLIKVAV